MTALADAAGWIGAVLLLTAYAGTATGRAAPHGRAVRTCNVLGSAGLAAVAAAHAAWPSVALNVVWLGIAAATWRHGPVVEPAAAQRGLPQ